MFAILAILLYIFCAIFGASIGWMRLFDNNTFEYLFNVLGTGCWYYGQFFFYCYLLNRLDDGFKDTEYRLSNKMFSILAILLFMHFIFSGMLMVAYISDISVYYSNFKTIERGCALIFDLLITSVLLIIFINKAYKVSKTIHDISWIADFEAKKEIENVEQNRMINIMSKVTMLSIIVIVVTQLTLIVSTIDWLVTINVSDVSDYGNMIRFAANNCVKAFHIFIASLCILLGFECTHNWYQFCCNKCHNKTKEYCNERIGLDIYDTL